MDNRAETTASGDVFNSAARRPPGNDTGTSSGNKAFRGIRQTREGGNGGGTTRLKITSLTVETLSMDIPLARAREVSAFSGYYKLVPAKHITFLRKIAPCFCRVGK